MRMIPPSNFISPGTLRRQQDTLARRPFCGTTANIPGTPLKDRRRMTQHDAQPETIFEPTPRQRYRQAKAGSRQP